MFLTYKSDFHCVIIVKKTKKIIKSKMKLTKSILTGIAAVCCITASAQKLSFDKETITTKNTMWKHPVTAVFKFTNKGKEPLIIKDVDPGCGCLTSKWTQGAIEKGEQGEIVVTYDAMQLGRFDRIIEVFSNAEDSPADIRMKGLVSVGDRQTIHDMYPYDIDDILLTTNNVELEVNKNDSAKTIINIYNGSKDVYTPVLMHLPPYITAKCMPEMIARGRKGTIELTVHGDKLNDFGLNQTNIYLARFAGDKVSRNNEINISAVLLPDISNMNGATPQFELSTTDLYLGKIGKKKKLTGTVKIYNKGAAPLHIDRLQAFNQAIMVNLPKTEIAPGENVKMQITVQAKYLEMSKAQPRVLIITNDPKHQKEVVTIKFE